MRFTLPDVKPDAPKGIEASCNVLQVLTPYLEEKPGSMLSVGC